MESIRFELTNEQLKDIKSEKGLKLISELGEVHLIQKKEEFHPITGKTTTEEAKDLLLEVTKQ